MLHLQKIVRGSLQSSSKLIEDDVYTFLYLSPISTPQQFHLFSVHPNPLSKHFGKIARYHKNEDGCDDAQLEHMLYRIVKSSCNDQQATFGALRQTYDAHETEDANRGCQLYLAVVNPPTSQTNKQTNKTAEIKTKHKKGANYNWQLAFSDMFHSI